jgi:hypothetical protein
MGCRGRHTRLGTAASRAAETSAPLWWGSLDGIVYRSENRAATCHTFVTDISFFSAAARKAGRSWFSASRLEPRFQHLQRKRKPPVVVSRGRLLDLYLHLLKPFYFCQIPTAISRMPGSTSTARMRFAETA